MACSKPLYINEKSKRKRKENSFNNNPFQRHSYLSNYSHSKPLDVLALQNSFLNETGFRVPCGWCLNCRIDKMNELTDRCEYEYISYGCGAFVTFTFDDYHIQPYAFIDSKDGQVKATLSKKCIKDFLNRLNKEVHSFCKKNGFTPFCRPDYKYLVVGEYGENGQSFDRCHYHCLFFGLDFAVCERMFWRAWQYQGSIQVGAIRNGGIGYVVSYLDKQIHGYESFLKYDYHNLQRPFQSHSLRLGEGLYKSQLKYIREHNGNYHWHGQDKPVPPYYKNKFLIYEDRTTDSQVKKYIKRINDIENLYNKKIHSWKQLQDFNLSVSQTQQKIREIKMVQNGKPVRNENYISREADSIINDKHRIPSLFDKQFLKIVTPSGNERYKIDKRILDLKNLKNRDYMKLHTDFNTVYNRLYNDLGALRTNQIFGIGDVPF